MTPHASTIGAVAREAMEMGDKHDSKAFKAVAVVTIGAMALAAVSPMLTEILKMINGQLRQSWRDRELERRGQSVERAR